MPLGMMFSFVVLCDRGESKYRTLIEERPLKNETTRSTNNPLNSFPHFRKDKQIMTELIVQQICGNIWLKCAFIDTRMTFGTLLEYSFLVIFGYRAIADLTCDKIGSHFPIWPPS